MKKQGTEKDKEIAHSAKATDLCATKVRCLRWRRKEKQDDHSIQKNRKSGGKTFVGSEFVKRSKTSTDKLSATAGDPKTSTATTSKW